MDTETHRDRAFHDAGMGHAETEVHSEFKVAAVKLVRQHGVSAAQAARDWTFTRMFCASGSRSLAPIRLRPFTVMAK
jgi:hypothetical protein